MNTCSVPGCRRRHYGRGFCRAHWCRCRRHGDPTGGLTERGAATRALLAALDSDTDECLVWSFSFNVGGYAQVNVDGSMRLVHAVACEHAHGMRPTLSHDAAHTCGNRSCINPRHVRWATRTENNRDKVQHGTQPMGERSHLAKLTAAEVLDIRRRCVEESAEQLARHYGVSGAAVRHIIAGRTWAWLIDENSLAEAAA